MTVNYLWSGSMFVLLFPDFTQYIAIEWYTEGLHEGLNKWCIYKIKPERV